MGSPHRSARALAASLAGLIALCAVAPAAAASEAGFSPPRSLTEVNGFAAAPAIAPDGRAVVAVSDYSAQRSRVLAYSRSAKGRWSDAEVVRTSAQELLEPRVSFTGDGTRVFAWMRAPRIDQEQVVEGRRMLPDGGLGALQRYSAPGVRGTSAQVAGGPGNLALVGWADDDHAVHVADGTGAAEPVFDGSQSGFSLDYLPDGTAVAAGQDFAPGGVQVRLRPRGGAWSAPQTLSGTHTARDAALAVGIDGTVAVAWAQNLGGDRGYRVQVSIRPPGGAFAAPRTLTAGAAEGRLPALAVQPDGRVTVAWLSGARLPLSVRGSEVRLATVRADGAATASRRVSAPGRRLAAAPQVFADAGGDTLVTWMDNRRLLAAVRDTSGRIAPPHAVSGAGARVFSSRVVANARGEALAVWSVDRGRGAALIQAAAIDF